MSKKTKKHNKKYNCNNDKKDGNLKIDTHDKFTYDFSQSILFIMNNSMNRIVDKIHIYPPIKGDHGVNGLLIDGTLVISYVKLPNIKSDPSLCVSIIREQLEKTILTSSLFTIENRENDFLITYDVEKDINLILTGKKPKISQKIHN